VTPSQVELGQARIQRFTTTATDVSWALEEGMAGGTLDQTGRYRAPMAAGEYHLTTTPCADSMSPRSGSTPSSLSGSEELQARRASAS